VKSNVREWEHTCMSLNGAVQWTANIASHCLLEILWIIPSQVYPACKFEAWLRAAKAVQESQHVGRPK
jgi:hypothetical protein